MNNKKSTNVKTTLVFENCEEAEVNIIIDELKIAKISYADKALNPAYILHGSKFKIDKMTTNGEDIKRIKQFNDIAQVYFQDNMLCEKIFNKDEHLLFMTWNNDEDLDDQYVNKSYTINESDKYLTVKTSFVDVEKYKKSFDCNVDYITI